MISLIGTSCSFMMCPLCRCPTLHHTCRGEGCRPSMHRAPGGFRVSYIMDLHDNKTTLMFYCCFWIFFSFWSLSSVNHVHFVVVAFFFCSCLLCFTHDGLPDKGPYYNSGNNVCLCVSVCVGGLCVLWLCIKSCGCSPFEAELTAKWSVQNLHL